MTCIRVTRPELRRTLADLFSRVGADYRVRLHAFLDNTFAQVDAVRTRGQMEEVLHKFRVFHRAHTHQGNDDPETLLFVAVLRAAIEHGERW